MTQKVADALNFDLNPVDQSLVTQDEYVENNKEELETVDRDFENSRTSIITALQMATLAAEQLFEISKSTESWKDYTALNSVLKSMSEMSSNLVNLYNVRQNYREKKIKPKTNALTAPNQGGDIHIGNAAVFTGTPAELKEFIKSIRKE